MNDLKRIPACGKQGHLAPAAIVERKALFDGILALCRRSQTCPSCAVAATLYASALAGIKGLHMSQEAFLDAAKEIYEDAERQLGSKVLA